MSRPRPAAAERQRAGTGAGADASPPEERLLSEITHELGNYFHKLYYWAEVVREQTGGREGEPGALLERTVRELETFLKTALELFRPIHIAPMTLAADEVARSTHALLGRHFAAPVLRWAADADTLRGAVSLDPGRFSFVVDGIARRLERGQPGAVDGETRGEAGRLVITLRVRGGGQPASGDVAAAIEWAVIERIVELHGGTLEADAATTRLTLPLEA